MYVYILLIFVPKSWVENGTLLRIFCETIHIELKNGDKILKIYFQMFRLSRLFPSYREVTRVVLSMIATGPRQGRELNGFLEN